MVNFKSKTEGEKFAFADEFRKRLKLIKVLKPSLSELDAIKIVAFKYYDSDLEGTLDCCDFIEEKCGKGVDITSAPLAAKRREYLNSLKDEVKAKEKQKKQKEDELDEKSREIVAAEKNRTDKEGKYRQSVNKLKNSQRIFYGLFWGAIILGVLLLASYGGVAGIFNAFTSVLFSNYTTIQLVSIVLLAAGASYVIDFFKGKGPKKEKKKKRFGFDKRKDDFKAQEEEYKKAQEKVDAKIGEKAAAQNAVNEANEELLKVKKTLEREENEISKCGQSDLSPEEIACVEIKTKCDEVKNFMEQNGASDKDKKLLDDWYNHYVGTIFYGTAKGTIKTNQDVEAVKREAFKRFEQVADPLDISNKTYNEANVKSGTNQTTNQTLDEMYAEL